MILLWTRRRYVKALETLVENQQDYIHALQTSVALLERQVDLQRRLLLGETPITVTPHAEPKETCH